MDKCVAGWMDECVSGWEGRCEHGWRDGWREEERKERDTVDGLTCYSWARTQLLPKVTMRERGGVKYKKI